MHFLHSHMYYFSGKLWVAERGSRRKVSSWCLWNGEDIPGKWPSSILAGGNGEILRDLGTNGSWREGAINQGKPVSMHYVKDIMCKASITDDLISLGNCSQSSLFMAIFVFSVPKSVKGMAFHLRSPKKSQFVDFCYQPIDCIGCIKPMNFTFARNQSSCPLPYSVWWRDTYDMWNQWSFGIMKQERERERERENCVALRRSLLIIFLPWRNSPYWAKDLIIEDSRSHSDTPHSVGLLWTSGQPVAETSTWQHTTISRDRHPYLRWDSNPQSQQASGRRPSP